MACEEHTNLIASNKREMLVNTTFRRDPTRTTMLRRRFSQATTKRFLDLKKDIQASIVDNDCFGIQPNVLRLLSPARTKAFEFMRTQDKVQAFIKWLEEQEKLGILQIIRRPGLHASLEGAWSDIFIDTAYAQGMRRARAELRKAGYQVPLFDDMIGGIRAVMNRPFHADRIGAIYTRTFEDLKSVTQVMNAQIRRKIADGLTTGLARGMAEGKNPTAIARELMKDVANRVDKIGITRARMIARTEVIRAHHVATIAEYEQASAEMEVEVMVEWSTAGFDVCEICAAMEGRTFTLTEIEGMIPMHPHCRCCVIPALKEEKTNKIISMKGGSM